MEREVHFRRFSAALPQEIRRLCTSESAGIPQVFGAFSAAFAHVFHAAFTSNFGRVFPQSFRKKSEGNSRLGRREKGRKRSGGRKGVENDALQSLWLRIDHKMLGSRRECTQRS